MASSQLFLILFTVSKLILYSNAQFKATPETTADLKAVLKYSLELRCDYSGPDGDGEFTTWYRDDDDIRDEKPGHYDIKQSPTKTILIIKIFVHGDAKIKEWYVKTKKPGSDAVACRFGPIALKSSPQGIGTNRNKEHIDSAFGSVRRNEDETVHFKCLIDPPPDAGSPNPIQWQYGKDDGSFSDLPDGAIVENSDVVISKVVKAHRGYYRCTLNDVSFTVLLRVKDRLAALWPFLGIVGVILVLVIVIIIFEKRQKSNKKPPASDDDEQDQANDPLVRTTTKGSDNDSKKRAVKA